jgi:3-demethoxyubiquinol 3-hydroxylase
MLMETTAHTGVARTIGDRIMKVNHAGEHDAVNIYSGQIFMARFAAHDVVAELTEFRAHEQRHRAIFHAELRRRGHRRCRSYWPCGIGGLALVVSATTELVIWLGMRL